MAGTWLWLQGEGTELKCASHFWNWEWTEEGEHGKNTACSWFISYTSFWAGKGRSSEVHPGPRQFLACLSGVNLKFCPFQLCLKWEAWRADVGITIIWKLVCARFVCVFCFCFFLTRLLFKTEKDGGRGVQWIERKECRAFSAQIRGKEQKFHSTFKKCPRCSSKCFGALWALQKYEENKYSLPLQWHTLLDVFLGEKPREEKQTQMQMNIVQFCS